MKWLTLNGKRDEAPVTAEDRRDEMLSAYLDGELSPAEVRLLERDLATDDDLRDALEGMREVRDLLASLELVPAPRSFALTAPPVAAPARTGTPRSELMARFGAMAAAVAFGVVVTLGNGADGLMSSPASQSADEPAIGLMAAPDAARSQESAPEAPGAGSAGNDAGATPGTGGGSDEGPAAPPQDGDTAGGAGAAGGAALATGEDASEDGPVNLEAAPDVERTASASSDDGAGSQTLLTTTLGGLTALLAGLSALLWWRRQRREAEHLGG